MPGYPNFKMIENFVAFEKPILEEFASHFPEISAVLMVQISNITACERLFEGAGPCSTFTLNKNCPPFPLGTKLEPLTLFLSDIDFLLHGASVTLFFINSKIDILDVATFEEDWPKGRIPLSYKISWVD